MARGKAACCGKTANGSQRPTHGQAKRIERHRRRCSRGGGSVHAHFFGLKCTACGGSV